MRKIKIRGWKRCVQRAVKYITLCIYMTYPIIALWSLLNTYLFYIMHNKLPQNWWLKITFIYYLPLSVGQKFGHLATVYLSPWLRLSQGLRSRWRPGLGSHLKLRIISQNHVVMGRFISCGWLFPGQLEILLSF